MTREEAISHIRDIIAESNSIKPSMVIFELEKEALRVAIEALEQEPCEDAISRREVIKKFTYNHKGKRIPDYDCDNFPAQISIKTVKEMLRELPSVTSQPKTDMLDKIRAEIEQYIDKEKLRFGGQFDSGLNLALKIIDKYKTESEVQDADSN